VKKYLRCFNKAKANHRGKKNEQHVKGIDSKTEIEIVPTGRQSSAYKKEKEIVTLFDETPQ